MSASPSVVPVTGVGPATVRVLRSEEEVEGLRAAWLTLGPDHPDADIDVFLTVCRLRAEVLSPYVLALERDGVTVGIAVARLERTRLETRIGYRVVYRPRLRAITVVYGGMLGMPDAAPVLLDALRDALSQGEADVVRLSGLRTDDPFFELASTSPSVWCRQHHTTIGSRWILPLPESMEDFWASRTGHARGHFRRNERRLIKAFADGDGIRVERFADATRIDALMDDLESISAKTYKRGLGVGFFRTDLQRALMTLGFARGEYRAWVMYLNGRPSAFGDGLRYRGTFHLGTIGFDPDPEFRSYGIGVSLLMRILAEACADDEITKFDYGFGEAEYKRRFADEHWDEADVLVYAPHPRAVTANMVRTSLLSGADLARRVVGDERTAKLKRAWRDRLARSSSDDA